MKLHVFNAADGDCLLAESNDDHWLLIDGGRSGTFQEHVAGSLELLADRDVQIDAVCVSHIDADHITGVIAMLDLLLRRRVHDFHTNGGNPDHPAPTHRMPDVLAIWHNGFEAQLGVSAGRIADTLATMSTVLGAATQRPGFAEEGLRQSLLVQSKRQSVDLSLTGLDVLGIPINGATSDPPPLVAGGPASPLGSMTAHVIGPQQADLDALQRKFVAWLDDHEDVVRDLEEEARRASRDLTDDIDALLRPLETIAASLGSRSSVTVPNLASIMLLLEEDGSRMVLTGDGHALNVVDGLEQAGLLVDGSGLHVDVLKIPHHGSEHNIGHEKKHPFIKSEFLRRVTADHYVFCGDGSHGNPEHVIVKAVIDSRLGRVGIRSDNPEVGRPFKVWFTAHPRLLEGADAAHMDQIRDYVTRRARRHTGTLFSEFLEAASFTIDPSLPLS